jgi:hypothetical protein
VLEAFARERLMKTQQAGKGLSECCGDLEGVEISDSAISLVVPSGVYKWSIHPFTNP